MSVAAVVQCIRYGSHWSPAVFKIAVIIANRINDETGYWDLWFKDICDDYGKNSRDKIYKALSDLEAEGVFRRTQQWKRGNQVKSRYEWTWTPEAGAGADSTVPGPDTPVAPEDSAVANSGHVNNLYPTPSTSPDKMALRAREDQVQVAVANIARRKQYAKLSAPELLAQFIDYVTVATDRLDQVNKGAFGGTLKRWMDKGVRPETILRAMEVFFADPRNTSSAGIGRPIWLKFQAFFVDNQVTFARAVGAEQSPEARRMAAGFAPLGKRSF